MALSSQQISDLVAMVVTVQPDRLDCDECFGRIDEYAQSQWLGRSLDEGMEAITTHLQQCPCCRDEYQALLQGLQELSATGS